MAVTAQSIIQRAVVTLHDTTSIRWPVNELVRYLNDGQREVLIYRPDAMNTTATMSLVAGTRQDLSAGSLTPTPAKLVEVTRNMSSSSLKGAVRLTNRTILDATTPGWHAITQSQNILHFMFDDRNPKVFYVYPPAQTGAQVEVIYAGYPTDISEPADGSLVAAVTGNISLPDIYSNSLVDYVLYRAYLKDSEFAGNAERANARYASFTSSLGAELTGTKAVQPKSSVTPT